MARGPPSWLACLFRVQGLGPLDNPLTQPPKPLKRDPGIMSGSLVHRVLGFKVSQNPEPMGISQSNPSYNPSA